MRIKLPVASGILTFVFAFYFSTAPTGVVYGQGSTAPATDPPASTFQPAMSIGLSSGTHAFFGIDATLRIMKPVNFRISYNRMRMDVEGISFNAASLGFSGQSLILSSDLDLSTLGLIAELPIGAKRSFRLMGGVMVNLNNYINVNGEFAEGVAVNDYELTPDRIGTINVNYTTGSAVYPYFGLGFGRSLGVRHLSFALEAGAMLRGRPDIEFNSTGLLSDNAQNGPVLSENFKNVRVHPSVGFRLAYKFKLPNDLFGLRPGAEGTSEMVDAPETEEEDNLKDEPKEQLTDGNPVLPKPTTPVASPYLIVKGAAVDAVTNVELRQAYVDLYKVLPNGDKTLERTGPYPTGQFTLGLDPGDTYELNITVPGYKPFKKVLKADPGGAAKTITQHFPLEAEQ